MMQRLFGSAIGVAVLITLAPVGGQEPGTSTFATSGAPAAHAPRTEPRP